MNSIFKRFARGYKNVWEGPDKDWKHALVRVCFIIIAIALIVCAIFIVVTFPILLLTLLVIGFIWFVKQVWNYGENDDA